MDFWDSGKKKTAQTVVEECRMILAADPRNRDTRDKLRPHGVNFYTYEDKEVPPALELDSIVLGKSGWHLIFKHEVQGINFWEDPRPFLGMPPFKHPLIANHSGNYGGFQLDMPMYNAAQLQRLGKYVCQLLGPEFDCFEHWQVQNSAGCNYSNATYYVRDCHTSATTQVNVSSYGGGYVPPYAFCVIARNEIVAERQKYRNKSAEAAKKAARQNK